MALIKDTTSKGFDTSAIKKGDFIRAKYTRWSGYQNGIVSSVTSSEIHVLYLTDIGNVSNFFTIYAEEVENDLWSIAYSSDLSTVATEGSDSAASS